MSGKISVTPISVIFSNIHSNRSAFFNKDIPILILLGLVSVKTVFSISALGAYLRFDGFLKIHSASLSFYSSSPLSIFL